MFNWVYRRTKEGRVNSASVTDALNDGGEVLIAVHGTFAGKPDNDGDAWWQRGSEFMRGLRDGLAERLSRPPAVLPFHWSGANSEFDRMRAGRRLASVMCKLEKKKRPYHILAHSHGGNVVVEAVNRFTRIGRKKPGLRSITTFGTPYFQRRLKPMSKLFLVYRALLFLAYLAFVAFMIYAGGVTLLEQLERTFANGDVAELVGALIGLGIMGGILYLIGALLWRSVAPLAREKARFRKAMRDTGLQQRWMALWARKDEAVGLLMRASGFTATFITARGMARTLARISAVIAALAIIAVPLTIYLSALKGQADRIASAAQTRAIDLIGPAGPALGVALLMFIVALPVFFLLHLVLSLIMRAGPHYLSAWFLNRTIVNGVRTGVFGDDTHIALVGVSATPEKLDVVTRELDTAALGGLADDDALGAAQSLYSELIEIHSGRVEDADPAGVWERLSDAICHNGYFIDRQVRADVVDHIAAHAATAVAGSEVRLAPTRPSAPAAEPAREQPAPLPEPA